MMGVVERVAWYLEAVAGQCGSCMRKGASCDKCIAQPAAGLAGELRMEMGRGAGGLGTGDRGRGRGDAGLVVRRRECVGREGVKRLRGMLVELLEGRGG